MNQHEMPMPEYSHEKAKSDAALHNLAVLIRHMNDAGIATVELEFDGYADEGNVHVYRFLDADDQPLAAAPELTIPGLQDAVQDQDAGPLHWTRAASEPLPFAVQVGLELVELRHPGWDDGLGAKGAISISAAETTVDFGQRVEELQFTEDRYQPFEAPLPAPAPRMDADRDDPAP